MGVPTSLPASRKTAASVTTCAPWDTVRHDFRQHSHCTVTPLTRDSHVWLASCFAEGVRCMRCLKGAYYRINGRCEKCPNSPAGMFVLAAVVLIFAIAVAYWMNRRKISIALVAIGVDYAQVLSMFVSTINWPAELRVRERAHWCTHRKRNDAKNYHGVYSYSCMCARVQRLFIFLSGMTIAKTPTEHSCPA